MVKCRYYRVAEHVFSVTAGEDVFALMTNYAPFEITAAEVKQDLLFALQVTNETMPEMEVEHVFTDRSDEDMPRIEIDKALGKGWLLGVSMFRDSDVCCHILSSEDFNKVTLYLTGEQNKRFALDNAAMLIFAFASVRLGTLEMHASVTVKDNLGYLFLGKSGTGKSTHSRQWLQLFPEAWLLNDDNPVVRFFPAQGEKEAEVIVYGSPWSGKTPCYKNAQVKVGGIVKLTQAPYNKATKLRLPEAYAFMLASSSGLKIVPETMDALYSTISQLITKVPMLGLECLPDTDAAQCCYDALKN